MQFLKCYLKIVLIALVSAQMRHGEEICRLKLESANCSNSNLIYLPLDLPQTITEIDVSNNQVSVIQWPIPYFNLIHLNLSKNKIHKIGSQGFYHLFNLVTLDLSSNNIEYLSYIEPNKTFYNTPRLVQLSLKQNPLKSLGSQPLRSDSLKRLDVSECEIKNLDGAVSLLRMPNLISLILDRNPIINADILVSESLEELYMAECQIQYIKSEFYIRLPKLKVLDLSENIYLRSLSWNGKASSLTLKILKADHCSIDYLDLHGFPKLERLYIKNNRISSISGGAFWSNGKLTEIDLSMNWIQHIDPMGFVGAQKLIKLDLSGNKIFELDSSLTPLSRLLYLNISNNPIFTMDGIESAFHLLSLDASHCDISSLPMELFRLAQIESVNLSRNAIWSLPTGMSSFTLTELNLGHNRLTHIDNTWFKHFPRLKTLHLDGNRLTEPFHQDTLKRLEHVKLYLQDNPWRCNCHEEAYRHLYNHISTKNGLNTLHCHGPINVSGLTWERACFQVETEASVKKSLKKNAWLPMLLAALATIGIIVLLYLFRRRSGHDEEMIRPRPREFSEEVPHIPRSPPRIETQLPTYEEALLMPKPKVLTKNTVDTQTHASFLGSARSLNTRAKHSIARTPSSNSL